MTTDNVCNIVLAVGMLEWRWLPCFAHTLQNALGLTYNFSNHLAFIWPVQKTCRAFLPYNSQSALKWKQEFLQLPYHELTQEDGTRWNSTFEMYKRIIEQQPAILAVLMEFTLSPSAITQLEDLATVLEPLAQASEYLATDSSSCSLQVSFEA